MEHMMECNRTSVSLFEPATYRICSMGMLDKHWYSVVRWHENRARYRIGSVSCDDPYRESSRSGCAHWDHHYPV
jgi:hypothetical protein